MSAPLLPVLACCLGLPIGTVAADPPAALQAAAERVIAGYNASDAAAVFELFSPEMKSAVPTEALATAFAETHAELGRAVELETPRVGPGKTAVYPVRFENGMLDLHIALDDEDLICGLLLSPHLPPLPVPERNTTPLRLPFSGDWLVYWGGDDKESNPHHRKAANQRFAFDFLGVDGTGATRTGTGEANEHYLCYGREVLAPADGVVTEAIDGVRENIPGSMNPFSALGNAVFIQHSELEVSVLAHLQCGSVRVKAGERVTTGQVIGLCGNSGNSSEPHLHYHLQNTPVIQDASGIKCFFRSVKLQRDGKEQTLEEYSPVKGDVVSPQTGAQL